MFQVEVSRLSDCFVLPVYDNSLACRPRRSRRTCCRPTDREPTKHDSVLRAFAFILGLDTVTIEGKVPHNH